MSDTEDNSPENEQETEAGIPYDSNNEGVYGHPGATPEHDSYSREQQTPSFTRFATNNPAQRAR